MESSEAMPIFAPSQPVPVSPTASLRSTRRFDREHQCPIGRAVREQLEQSPYRALQSVGCNVQGATVTLTGRVRSFYMKQMAQHLVGQLQGIERVNNELSVA
jgi:hypothetical protein